MNNLNCTFYIDPFDFKTKIKGEATLTPLKSKRIPLMALVFTVHGHTYFHPLELTRWGLLGGRKSDPGSPELLYQTPLPSFGGSGFRRPEWRDLRLFEAFLEHRDAR